MDVLIMSYKAFHGNASFQLSKRDSLFNYLLLVSVVIFLVILSCLVSLDAFGIVQIHPVLRLGTLSPGSTMKLLPEEPCDYFYGKWVHDEGHQRYGYKEDCPFLDPGFRCQKNGRTDLEYQKWRWQPFGCNLPKFDARDMLERSRNGRLVFVGDSIGRNQWESLICMLADGVSNKSAIYEMNGNPINKHKGYLAIKFEEFNCSIEYYRDPFLISVSHPPKNSPSKIEKVVRVDKLCWHSTKWTDADIIVLNAGHWWTPDKTINRGVYFEEGGRVNMTMDTKSAFQKSLKTVKNWIFQKVNLQQSYVYFRSYSPAHFKGAWNEGGTCSSNREPETSSTELEGEPWQNQILNNIIEKMKPLNENVMVLNITYLTEFRKDGHPSIHHRPGNAEPVIEDCSHWCLPGVPDTWNELLYSHLLSRGYKVRR